MSVSTERLTAAAGLCAAAAGAIFIGVQVNHPPADVAPVVTTEMAVREAAKALMTVLAIAGITGMFLRNQHRFGVLGYLGYVVLTIGYLSMFVIQSIVALVLPELAASNPTYVQHFIDAAMGGAATSDIGHMKQLFMVTGLGYAFGGLLFGIALFRAGILARWASVLLVYGTTSALALAVLPESFSRPFAVPTGVALIGLGLSLYRTSRTPGSRVPVAAPAGQPASVR
jgi:hypothetical protein